MSRSEGAARTSRLATLGARARRLFDGLLRRARSGPDGVARIQARQIYILPSRIGLAFGAVVLLMLLGSLNYQNNLGLLFTFFLAALGLVAMHHAWFNLLGLAVQARGGAAVFAGEPATFELSLWGAGRRARPDLRVRLGDAEAAPALHVPSGDRASLRLAAPSTRRGPLTLPELRIETRHPLHLFVAWCLARPEASTLVYPAPAAQAPPPGAEGGDARQPLPSGTAEGRDDYAGSRDYRHGDSLRHIDWKAYARERGLLVKEFEGEQGGEVWVDWSSLATPDTEQRLRLLARQLLDAAAAGPRFGLRLPGIEERPARGEAHLHRCLTHLALFDHG